MKYYAINSTDTIKTTSDTAVLRVSDTDELITEQNINMYKAQDLNYITQNGGELATDEEYIEAEIRLQQLYLEIMGTENE